MSSPIPWRRISDWKAEVHLVHRDDLTAEFLERYGLIDPVERLRARFPELALALEQAGFLRIEADVAALLHESGRQTCSVAYHRGVDGLSYTEHGPGGGVVHLEVAAFAGELEDLDDPMDDAVDALLRIHTEGLLTERAVLLAHAAPALATRDALDELSDDLAHLDLDGLPDVPPEVVERVAEILAQQQVVSPPTGVYPDLTHAQRRGYQRQALLAGGLALLATGAGAMWAPMLMALTVPIFALAAVVYAIHAAILWQERDRPQ